MSQVTPDSRSSGVCHLFLSRLHSLVLFAKGSPRFNATEAEDETSFSLAPIFRSTTPRGLLIPLVHFLLLDATAFHAI